MKKLVVDSNIAFSGILNTDSKIGQILLKAPGEAAFFSCDFLKSEIREHRPKLLKITKLPPGNLDELESLVLQKVQFISETLLDVDVLDKAEDVLADIDPDDAPFLALAWQLEAKLWSGDKKLRDGLLKKGYTDVLNTQEVHAWLTEEDAG